MRVKHIMSLYRINQFEQHLAYGQTFPTQMIVDFLTQQLSSQRDCEHWYALSGRITRNAIVSHSFFA